MYTKACAENLGGGGERGRNGLLILGDSDDPSFFVRRSVVNITFLVSFRKLLDLVNCICRRREG